MENGEIHTEFVYQVPIVLEERAVFTLFCNILGTAEIDVDAVAVVLNYKRGGNKFFGVVGAELHEQRPVHRWIAFLARGNVKVFPAVGEGIIVREHLYARVRGVANEYE